MILIMVYMMFYHTLDNRCRTYSKLQDKFNQEPKTVVYISHQSNTGKNNHKNLIKIRIQCLFKPY